VVYITYYLAEGSTVAVFGCGAIGLGVIQTSGLVKASRIIAVDTNPNKKAWAIKMGATDFVNPMDLQEGKRIQDHLIDITDGGLDYTFDCTGNVSHIYIFSKLKITYLKPGQCYARST